MVNCVMHLICLCEINLRRIVLQSTVLHIYHNSGHMCATDIISIVHELGDWMLVG